MEPQDLDFFHSVLGETGVVTDTDTLDFYNTCALRGRECCLEINATFYGYVCVLAFTAETGWESTKASAAWLCGQRARSKCPRYWRTATRAC